MKLRIDAYSFGSMTIGGREFTADLIVYPDGRIQDDWWRKEGHSLVPDDIAAVLDAAPRKLIIGTGESGLMRVSASVLESCRKRGIQVEACPTADAVTRFNAAAEARETVAACFHLTC